MKKGTLIMLCGLPGSGKSTLAEQLEKARNAIRFWPDDWTIALGANTKDMQEWNRIHGIVEKLLQRHLSIVYDDTNFSFEQRKKLRQIANKYGAATVLLYINQSITIIKERIFKNSQKKHRVQVHPDDFVFVQSRFEVPKEEENAIEFTNDQSIETWINKL